MFKNKLNEAKSRKVNVSQQPARRNCSTGEDAGYPRLDGKTPWSFTVV